MIRVKYPFGKATVLTPDSAAVLNVTVDNDFVVCKPTTLAADATINAIIDAETSVGAMFLLEVKSDGTARATTLGTGFKAPVIAGVINKTKSQLFVFDGVQFVPAGAAVQID